MNKVIKKCIVLLLPFGLSLSIVSCQKDPNKIDWGIAKIYMPQAEIVSGGINNNYPVPWSSGNGVENYTIDSSQNTLNVILGVYRSGLESLDGYSVQISTNSDTVNHMISNGTLTNSALLPSDAYTMPSSVSVQNGQRETTFLLTVNKTVLDTKYVSLKGEQLVLAVTISNPSKYSLNESLSTTIVIIDPSLLFP